MSTYRDFFEFLTGFPPYPWQERLQTHLLQGRSVILRVPTGAGKTWGAVAPFLHGMITDRPLADRLLYALPLRALASSLHATVHHGMSSVFGSITATGKDRDYSSAARSCSLQFGGQKNDPFFESDLVFTTIDQLLSSYVLLPVSLPDRLGNINAGALIGSLLVFDELHLLDPEIALGTTIEMLIRLKGLCQFVLMTATMSDEAMDWLALKLDAKVAEITDDEIRALPSQRTKQRTWRYSNELITAEAVRAAHRNNRSIALVNSVGRAQDLFLELQQFCASEPDPPELVLLHSRFYPEDRQPIEARLSGYFGPDATSTNVILVTTQVVEAGMDLSADQLHTEIAPMNALIQRAGRTARYADRCVGSVTVYEPTTLGPYKKLKDVVDATRDSLQKLPPEGKLVDFADENSWITDVHAVREYKKLQQFSPYDRKKHVNQAMDEGQRGLLSRLVRDISSVGVLITKDPKAVDFNRGAWPRLLSLSGFSLMTLREKFSGLADGQWVVQGATDQPSDQQGMSLQWSVLSANQLPAQWLIAIHPDFASYDSRFGLVLGRPAVPPPLQYSERPPTPRYQYEFETWTRHAERIVGQSRAMRRHSARAAQSLSSKYQIPAETIEALAEVVCVLHDTGKLSEQWQQRAWLRQNDKDAKMRVLGHNVPARPQVPIAHTWYDPDADYHWQRDPRYALPPHAVEGAFAVREGLLDHLSGLLGEDSGLLAAVCAYTAIARHHGPRSKQLKPFQLCRQSVDTVSAGLPTEWSGFTVKSCEFLHHAEQFPDILLSSAWYGDAWPLCIFLVRRLRLADQASLRPSP